MCVIGMVLFGAATALLLLQPAPDRQGLGMLPVAGAGFLLSLAFWGLVRDEGRPVARRLDLGLLFHILTGFVIAWLELPRVTGRDVLLDGLSSLAVWQLIYPGLVPTRRRDIAVAAGIVTLAIPAVSLGSALLGRTIDLGAVGVATLPVAVAGGVGVALAAVLYDLGRQLKEARDVGSYRLVTRVGRGGMGEVWSAEHRLLRKPAAVKLIRREALERAGSGRPDPRVLFEREANATAALRSPHTVELYDYGVREDGTFYYVMELLDGLTVDQLLRAQGPLPPARVLHLLHGAALSLGEAHAAGLIHRDVKAANLMVCRQGSSWDVLKLLDFGLVQTEACDASEPGSRPIRGTPQTLAPELARGEAATDRTDIYAVGCVAFRMLSGVQPFDARGAQEWLLAHLREEPMPPSARLGAPLPAELDALVLRCMAKDPGARPSARELVGLIEGCEDFGRWDRRAAAHAWGESP